jgi:hypothetical protein
LLRTEEKKEKKKKERMMMMMMMRAVERSVCLTDDHVRLCVCKMNKETIEEKL